MIGGLPPDQINACAEVLRKGDPDRFRVAMAAPPEARARMLPILAMNVEVSRAPYLTKEPMIALMRLQWWRDAVAEAVAGKPPRAHEVAAPLAKVIADWGLPEESFERLITARQWDIEEKGFADDAAFRAHIAATGGELVWLSAAALGLPDEKAEAARAAGYAMGLANWFLAIPALEAQGKQPLADGRPEAVQRLAAEGLDHLKQARAVRGIEPAVPALRLATHAGPILRRAIRDPSAVGDGRLAASEFSRRAHLYCKALVGGW